MKQKHIRVLGFNHLHRHPQAEKFLNLDSEHVIVDRKDWEEIIDYFRRYPQEAEKVGQLSSSYQTGNSQFEPLLQKAIEKWGKEHQINKIEEEAIELALVLAQRKCATKDPKEIEEQLYSELADNTIMIRYAHILFDSARINEQVHFKLNRLQSLLSESSNQIS